VLVATLKGPRLAPSTRLINDLEDHSLNGVSGQQPHPIFRPERASPQGIPRLIRKRSDGKALQVGTLPAVALAAEQLEVVDRGGAAQGHRDEVVVLKEPRPGSGT